jgi:peptide/nickel transport system ATP-binding protein
MSDVLLELDSVHVNFAARKNWLGRVTEQVMRSTGWICRSVGEKRWALSGNPAAGKARWPSC